MTITEDMQAAIGPPPREGVDTGLPAGMRVIVRKERPRPAAQLRFTDVDGHRFTAFATDARKGEIVALACEPPARTQLLTLTGFHGPWCCPFLVVAAVPAGQPDGRACDTGCAKVVVPP